MFYIQEKFSTYRPSKLLRRSAYIWPATLNRCSHTGPRATCQRGVIRPRSRNATATSLEVYSTATRPIFTSQWPTNKFFIDNIDLQKPMLWSRLCSLGNLAVLATASSTSYDKGLQKFSFFLYQKQYFYRNWKKSET